MQHLEQVATAAKGLFVAAGGGLLLAQVAPDFALPPWARDSIGMAALFFLGWLLLQERRDHRAQLAEIQTRHSDNLQALHRDKTERLEAVYKSRLEEAREYTASLDAVRREQHEHTQRIYQDLVDSLRGGGK